MPFNIAQQVLVDNKQSREHIARGFEVTSKLQAKVKPVRQLSFHHQLVLVKVQLYSSTTAGQGKR